MGDRGKHHGKGKEFNITSYRADQQDEQGADRRLGDADLSVRGNGSGTTSTHGADGRLPWRRATKAFLAATVDDLGEDTKETVKALQAQIEDLNARKQIKKAKSIARLLSFEAGLVSLSLVSASSTTLSASPML